MLPASYAVEMDKLISRRRLVQPELVSLKISELRRGMRGVNVKGKVLDVSEVREVMTRYGTQSRVATATLEDDSGSIKLTLWNEDIGKVSPGDLVEIRNGYVNSFRGVLQLNVGRFGRIRVIGREE